jgi:LemA protein
MNQKYILLPFLFALSFLLNCGYNQIQVLDEQVNASAAEVLNQYQRRADLIPNLGQVVKGYANKEEDILVKVTEARSRVGSMQMTPEMMNNPEALGKFQKAQGELGGFLSRLMVVQENYPNLKSDSRFADLQAQLEGTENRITVARNRHIQAVQEFNTTIRQFPEVLTAKMFGYATKPSFTVENETEIKTAPKVNFE